MLAVPDFVALCADPLLRRLLASVPVADVELEGFLTAIRRRLLDAATTGGDGLAGDMLGFACALAQQCFINEYVFSQTEAESALAQRLHDAVAAALTSGTSVAALPLMALACYVPLAAVPGTAVLLDQPWPESVATVLIQQIREPQEEARLAASIPQLTVVDDAVSRQVQQQYEENPYPRWVHAAPAGKPVPLDQHLRAKFPLACFQSLRKRTLDLLIAGCGTGQHAIETTQLFVGANTLAIDLSRRSLAYAVRKTRQLGLTNIAYRQADILKLAAADHRFDAIEASGVRHHMANPMQGWRVLIELLRPGGFMALGLYSEIARRDITAVRRLIAERHLTSRANDIRRCRRELMSASDGTPMKNVTSSVDFFSISGCRDLLFHAQEHCLTLSQIEAFLGENDLEFLGFDIDAPVLARYRRNFPHDKAMTNLKLWHAFESENPRTFAGMYQFWLQKRP